MTLAAVSASRCLLGRSPGRIHLAALLHVVDRPPSGGDQRPQGEGHEEKDENQGEAGRVTNTRLRCGLWAASASAACLPMMAPKIPKIAKASATAIRTEATLPAKSDRLSQRIDCCIGLGGLDCGAEINAAP
jgi:hypothetical protein